MESLYGALMSQIGAPAEWELLFKPKTKEFISTEVRQLEPLSDVIYNNPTLNEPDKPISAFVRDGASIPVLHDWDILQIFSQEECLPAYPCFLRAGEQAHYRFNPTEVKVGILIAGGIAAGLNMVVDSIVKRHFSLATQMAQGGQPSLRIYGYDGGYKGMVDGRQCLLAPTRGAALRVGYEKDRPTLDIRSTDQLSRAEGSILLKAGRGEDKHSNDEKERLARLHAEKIVQDGLDILYVIGGNGTLGWAGYVCHALSEMPEARRIAVVGGPKTMDNDVLFTDATFGFRTAVDVATDFVLAIHADASSQDRIGLLELFGAATGWVALYACYDSGEGDEVLIRERVPDDPEKYDDFLSGIFHHIESRVDRNDHAVIIVAEGAMPEYQWRDHGARDLAFANLHSKLKKRFGPDRETAGKRPFSISDVRTRYLVRSTPPNTFDIELCKVTGKMMVDTALAGFTGCTVNRWQNDYVLVPFETATSEMKKVPVWDYFYQTFLDKQRIEKSKSG
jgi:6-phosphofructokinase 1